MSDKKGLDETEVRQHVAACLQSHIDIHGGLPEAVMIPYHGDEFSYTKVWSRGDFIPEGVKWHGDDERAKGQIVNGEAGQ